MKSDKDIFGDDSLDSFEDDSTDTYSAHYFERKDADPCDDYWEDLAG